MTPTTVPVTQADRDAAAALLGYRDWADATDYRLTGRQDREVARTVQAFARHRLASTQEPAGEIEAIADAIERGDVGYRMELTRLVDGESTYTLTYEDGSVFEFPDTDEVYKHVRQTKRKAQAREVLSALRTPASPFLREEETLLRELAAEPPGGEVYERSKRFAAYAERAAALLERGGR